MNNLFTKELCIYMIDATDDYFLHHKLLMISKPYYEYCNSNKEQRQYDLICRFQYIEFSIDYDGQSCIYKVNGITHRIDSNLPAVIYEDGTQQWYQNNKLHRDNGPAVIESDGDQEWYLNDKCHRDNDLPAVICINGRQEWYQNDYRHRDNDLPAIIDVHGRQEWYLNGKRHRDNDLPAVIDAYGTQEWYRNGERHRDNGPAIIYSNGTQCWYLYDNFIKSDR